MDNEVDVQFIDCESKYEFSIDSVFIYGESVYDCINFEFKDVIKISDTNGQNIIVTKQEIPNLIKALQFAQRYYFNKS